MPFSDDDLDAFYREMEARTAAQDDGRRRDLDELRAAVGQPQPSPEEVSPVMSDADLERYYRDIESRTAATPARRPPRPRHDRLVERACPTPGKHAFAAENLARDGIVRIRRERGVRAELRCYRCVCGAWHITSRPTR